MAAVTDLVTNFSFTGSTAPMTGFIGALNQGIGLIFGFDKGLVGLGQSVIDLTHDIVGSIDPLVQLQRETGVAIEKMQELGFAASQNGSSLEAVTSTVSALSEKIGEASIKGSEDFARLGISIVDSTGKLKTADKVLNDVRKRFSSLGLTMQQQQSLAGSLGIDSTLIQLLNKTDGEMDSLINRARELGVASKEEGDQLAKLQNNFEAVRFGMDALQRATVIGLAPAIEWLTETFIDSIIPAMKSFNVFIGRVLKAIGRSLPVLGALTIAFKGSAIATGLMTAATKAFGIAVAVVTSPITVWVAAIAGAVAIIDDLVTAFNGGQSVIKDFFQEFFNIDITPILRNIVDSFIRGIATIKNAIGGFFTGAFGSVFGGNDVTVTNQQILKAQSPGGNQGTRVNQDVNITINANNAEEARRGVIQGLDFQSQLENASNQSRRGGL